MKMVVRAFALLLLIGTIGVWAGLGGSLGWTKTSIAVREEDPVTGIEAVNYEPALVPGVEFLAVGIGGALVIFASTLFVRMTPRD